MTVPRQQRIKATQEILRTTLKHGIGRKNVEAFASEILLPHLHIYGSFNFQNEFIKEALEILLDSVDWDKFGQEIANIPTVVRERAKAESRLYLARKKWGLSEVEYTVMRHYALGYTVRHMAAITFISPRTIECHLSRIIGKLYKFLKPHANRHMQLFDFYFHTLAFESLEEAIADFPNDGIDFTIVSAEKLTPMQLAIAASIVEGKSTTEIAEKFYISKRTVDSHKQNIYAKFGWKNCEHFDRGVAIAIATELGYLNLCD